MDSPTIRTIGETALTMKVSERTVRRWIATGLIPAEKIIRINARVVRIVNFPALNGTTPGGCG
jgi:hypothetical protein